MRYLFFFNIQRTSLPFQNSADNDSWPHLKLLFLQPDKIRDGNRRLKTDPNYDPKTLYVPEDFKNKLTPVSFIMKSENVIEVPLKENFVSFFRLFDNGGR